MLNVHLYAGSKPVRWTVTVLPDDYYRDFDVSNHRQCVNDRTGGFSYTVDQPAGGQTFHRSDELWMLASQAFLTDCFRRDSIQSWMIYVTAQVVSPSGELGPVRKLTVDGLYQLIYRNGELSFPDGINLFFVAPVV